HVCPPSVAELRAGSPCRPPRGTLAAATDECFGGSEVRPACRHAVDFPFAKERPARQLERGVRCDVPGRCSLKRVVHPGDFRQSESSQTNRSTGRSPNGRPPECAKLPGKSRSAEPTSPTTWLVAPKGGGGRWPERAPRAGV